LTEGEVRGKRRLQNGRLETDGARKRGIATRVCAEAPSWMLLGPVVRRGLGKKGGGRDFGIHSLPGGTQKGCGPFHV